nr:hypothetical protein [Amycolatopsis sp. Hca4]
MRPRRPEAGWGERATPGAPGVTPVMVSPARVTVSRESARPSTAVFAPRVIAPRARIVPDKNESAPVLAAPSATQNTLAAFAPLTRSTRLPAAVSNAASVWKRNTASGLPCASRVTVPVRASAAPAWCTPAWKVRVPRSPTTSVCALREEASPWAASRSACACWAAGSFTCRLPATMPGGNPLTEVLGLTPRSPLRTVGPVFTTPVPAPASTE